MDSLDLLLAVAVVWAVCKASSGQIFQQLAFKNLGQPSHQIYLTEPGISHGNEGRVYNAGYGLTDLAGSSYGNSHNVQYSPQVESGVSSYGNSQGVIYNPQDLVQSGVLSYGNSLDAMYNQQVDSGVASYGNPQAGSGITSYGNAQGLAYNSQRDSVVSPYGNSQSVVYNPGYDLNQLSLSSYGGSQSVQYNTHPSYGVSQPAVASYSDTQNGQYNMESSYDAVQPEPSAAGNSQNDQYVHAVHASNQEQPEKNQKVSHSYEKQGEEEPKKIIHHVHSSAGTDDVAYQINPYLMAKALQETKIGFPYNYMGFPYNYYGFPYGMIHGYPAGLGPMSIGSAYQEDYLCPENGVYYRDVYSFYICQDNISRIQMCAPGSMNVHNEDLLHVYQPSDFCTINILDRSFHPFVVTETVTDENEPAAESNDNQTELVSEQTDDTESKSDMLYTDLTYDLENDLSDYMWNTTPAEDLIQTFESQVTSDSTINIVNQQAQVDSTDSAALRKLVAKAIYRL